METLIHPNSINDTIRDWIAFMSEEEIGVLLDLTTVDFAQEWDTLDCIVNFAHSTTSNSNNYISTSKREYYGLQNH